MKRLILGSLIGVVFALLLSGDVAAVVLFVSMGTGPAHANTPTAAQKAAAKPKPAAPVYFAGIDSLVISLPPDQDGDQQYADIGISFSTHQSGAVDDFNAMLPIIKSRLIAIALANGGAIVNNRASAADALTQAALPMVNQVVAAQDPKLGYNPFIGAYLTNLVLQ